MSVHHPANWEALAGAQAAATGAIKDLQNTLDHLRVAVDIATFAGDTKAVLEQAEDAAAKAQSCCADVCAAVRGARRQG